MSETTTIAPAQRTGRPRKKRDTSREASISYRPTVMAVCQAVATGAAREMAVFGTRGDGKTQGALGAMLMHAAEHHRLGFDLPVKWIGVTDTFASHKLKTVPSLEQAFWKGTWRGSDGGHLYQAIVNGNVMVELHLFGLEDQGAMDRVRMECHGVWFEEPAPTAVLVSSHGVNEEAWAMALTSQRLATHAPVALMTLNYPDEDHWTWQRFLPQAGITGQHPDDPTRRWFRVPPGERASAEQRAAWTHALRDRPDLLRRLLEGQPGSIQLGPQVADGFRLDRHVSPTRLVPLAGEPLVAGVDFGHTPTIVLGQIVKGRRQILCALSCVHGGVKQFVENEVRPWLASHTPWVLNQPGMLVGCYDPSGQTGEQSDIERDAVSTLERLVPGLWFPGPVRWESRQHTLLAALNHHVMAGEPSLTLDAVGCKELIQSLSGRWHYALDRQGQIRRDTPKKPNHPWEDYGDALIYWLWALTSESQPLGMTPKVEMQFELGRR